DISSVPTGSRGMGVQLSFWVTGKLVGDCKIYDLIRAWSESEATWKTSIGRQGWYTPGAAGDGDRMPTPVGFLAPSTPGWTTITLDVPGVEMVQRWINDPRKNCGISVAGPDVNEWGLDSREVATPERRPKLTVTYLPK